MKLPKVTSNDPIERQALGLHKSTVAQLQLYRAYYQSVHGDDISMSMLVEEICKRFMHEDRSFHKFSPSSAAGVTKSGADSAAATAVTRTGSKV